MPLIISIEGNIGSGKTTLLEYLKIYFKSKPIIFLREPVDEWENIKDSQGNTMLQKFYDNQHKYAFSFQMMAYISRLSILKDTIEHNPNAIIITERSLMTDRHVFAKMLYDSGKIEDVNYQIYQKWFDNFSNYYTINKIIYVKTSPNICFSRINQRDRVGESVIPIDYLENCSRYHDDMLYAVYDNSLLTLDGNINLIEQPEQLQVWINLIELFIS
jgi:deoxyadenosine/deoxycytidine kinase